MIPLISTVSSFLLRPLAGGKEKVNGDKIAEVLKDRFNPDHAFLARDERHAITLARSRAGESDGRRVGRAGPEGEGGIDWLEWAFAGEVALGDCRWHDVRWRFYRNGRISFQARMDNASGRFDGGDMQGHRIEIRSADGHLLGAWTAAFFVRAGSAVDDYPATILDEHPLLALHFDELAERQSGLWFHER